MRRMEIFSDLQTHNTFDGSENSLFRTWVDYEFGLVTPLPKNTVFLVRSRWF